MPGANAALIAEAAAGRAQFVLSRDGRPCLLVGRLADALVAAESRAQANAAALADEIAAVVIGGAGARRVCDGPGAYMAECGPTYDDIFNAHRELERICDAALREGEATP